MGEGGRGVGLMGWDCGGGRVRSERYLHSFALAG